MKTKLSRSFLRRSLKLWGRRQHYRYRKYRHYRARGLVADATRWRKLAHAADRKVVLRKKQLADLDAPTLRQRAVALAGHFAKIGVTENPANSNSGPFITQWQRATARGGLWLDRTPWCGTFVENMAREHGVKTSTRWASVWFIHQDAVRAINGFSGWTTNRASVRPGDLVTLFNDAHVEMVEEVLPSGVQTIGGNTSPGIYGSQANGGGVYRRFRPYSVVTGFALVDYPS